MRKRNLTREQALEEYVVYRKRVRELLDMAQVARDIKRRSYEPRDFLGRGPGRFSNAVGNAIMGLFASLLDHHKAALNVFDVWLALFPGKRGKINQTWQAVEPHVQSIRNYRNDIVCHANKSLRRQAETYLTYHKQLDEVVKAMQRVSQLAAELMRDEATALPNLRVETEPILNRALAPLANQLGPEAAPAAVRQLKRYFLQDDGPQAAGGQSRRAWTLSEAPR
jgi:hypothetical protein